MMAVVDRDQLPKDLEPRGGQELNVQQPDGRQFIVAMIDVTASTVTLDANYHQAGESLTFELELVDVL